MLPIIHHIANTLFEGMRTLLGPMGFIVAPALLGMIGWSLVSAARDGVTTAKRMHAIPCSSCQFYTGDHRLKCPVHPTEAASEDAIGCRDYQRSPLM